MVTIYPIDKDGRRTGADRPIPKANWENLKKFGSSLRWREEEKKEENIDNPKKGGSKNGRKKRRVTGDSVKKA